ncbi:MAG: phosphatase PAP2 family protein [Patescibacteria group bacterium]
MKFTNSFQPPLFWRPQTDFLKLLESSQFGKILLIIFNYAIWFLFLYLSILLVGYNPNIFWQLLVATVLAEIVEKLIKKKVYWRRPMFVRHDATPVGLVDRWYQSGAFPSGHTIKATFFFLFLLLYPVFNIQLYFLIVLPLLFFRVLVGFHYPIDVFGGILIGILMWLSSFRIIAPLFAQNFIKIVYDFVFSRL